MSCYCGPTRGDAEKYNVHLECSLCKRGLRQTESGIKKLAEKNIFVGNTCLLECMFCIYQNAAFLLSHGVLPFFIYFHFYLKTFINNVHSGSKHVLTSAAVRNELF